MFVFFISNMKQLPNSVRESVLYFLIVLNPIMKAGMNELPLLENQFIVSFCKIVKIFKSERSLELKKKCKQL